MLATDLDRDLSAGRSLHVLLSLPLSFWFDLSAASSTMTAETDWNNFAPIFLLLVDVCLIDGQHFNLIAGWVNACLMKKGGLLGKIAAGFNLN